MKIGFNIVSEVGNEMTYMRNAIAKKHNSSVSILVKENSRAKELLIDDKKISEIIILDRTKNNAGSHDGIKGFFKLASDLKKYNFDKVFIFNF